jgi:hypothetical protein
MQGSRAPPERPVCAHDVREHAPLSLSLYFSLFLSISLYFSLSASDAPRAVVKSRSRHLPAAEAGHVLDLRAPVEGGDPGVALDAWPRGGSAITRAQLTAGRFASSLEPT